MSAPAVATEFENPYPGLRPFEPEDFAHFFGRDDQIDDLLVRLNEHRFVAVVGLSGSGKSSLVRAGLIHRLQVGHLTNAGSRWKVALFRPGSQPIDSLTDALDSTLGKQPSRSDQLRKSTQALLNSTQEGREPDQNLLLVVDQFEEIFRFQREKQLSERDAAHFVDLLLAAEQDLSPNHRVYVVLTMRTDYLGDCAQFDGLPRALNKSQYLVPRLTKEQCRLAIEGPAALTDTDIDPDLMQVLLAESAEGRDTLPLLQHALSCLWDMREPSEEEADVWKITLNHYTKKLGGMAKALNDHADRAYDSLGSNEHKNLARDIFKELTEIGQGRDQRRPQRLSQLAFSTHSNLDEVRGVAEHFLAESFLTSPDHDRTKDWEADLTHESLIRQWKKLNEWANDEAQDRDDYLYFAKRVEKGGASLTGPDLALGVAWLEKGHGPEWAARYGGDYARTVELIQRSHGEELRRRAEKELEKDRKLKRARSLLMVFGAVACVFALLLIWAIKSYRDTARAKQIAEDSQRDAIKSKNAAVTSALQARAAQNAEEAAKDKAEASLGEANRQRARAEVNAREAKEKSDEAGTSLEFAKSALDEAIKRRQEADAAREQAKNSEDDAKHSAMESKTRELIASSRDSLNEDPERSILLALYAMQKVSQGQTPMPAAEEALHQALFSSQVRLNLDTQKELYSVSFSPDGSEVALSGTDGTAGVWNLKTGNQRLALKGHKAEVFALIFSPDGRLLASASEDRTAKIWDASNGKELKTLSGHTGPIWGVAFSADSTRLATAGQDKSAIVWNVSTGAQISKVSHASSVVAVAFSPDGKSLLTGSGDKTAKLWETNTGKQLQIFEGHTRNIHGVAFSPDGNKVATASWDSKLKVWDPKTGKPLLTLKGHDDGVYSVAFSPDSKRLASVSMDGTAKLWDAETGRELTTLYGHADQVVGVSFSRDGSSLATASVDKTAKVWNAHGGEELETLPGHSKEIRTVAFTPNGSQLVTSGLDETVKLWDVASGKNLKTLTKSDGEGILALSPDGKRLATSNGVGSEIVLLSAEDGSMIKEMDAHGMVSSIAFSPDGTRIAISTGDDAKLLNAETGAELQTFKGHADFVNAAVFSPDGKRLATASDDHTAKVWNVEGGKVLQTLPGHSKEVRDVAFSPDGKRLASVSDDHTVRVWNAESGDFLFTMVGHSAAVTCVSYSPDGKYVLTGSYDKSARLWNAATGAKLMTFRGDSGVVGSVAFGPDGHHIATGTHDGTVEVYTLVQSELVELAHKRLAATHRTTLTKDECQQYFQTQNCQPPH